MIFKFYAMSRNDWLLNSLPLPVRIDHGVPKCYPMFKYSIDDVRTFFTRNPDFDSVSTNIVNRVKYFVAIDFFDIHGNIFVKI